MDSGILVPQPSVYRVEGEVVRSQNKDPAKLTITLPLPANTTHNTLQSALNIDFVLPAKTQYNLLLNTLYLN